MSFRVVRQSKFRHIFGSNAKREQCYDNIRVSKSSWDSTFCAVNPNFIAVIVESGGGGAFLVLPLSKTGRVAPDAPVVGGHKGPVLDIAWCPHNDHVIASASEDCYVKVWQIPEGGLTRTMTDPIVDLLKHQRRVGIVLWHPSAQNILLSAGSDNMVVIWNVGTGEALNSFTLPDLVYSGSWKWDGSEVLFTCKDRKIRRVDPRSGEIEEEAIAHEGNKPSRAIFLKNGLVFTTGFTRSSERQYSLRAPGHLDDPIVMTELDTSNGVMFPIYDPDASLVYLCGKGDSVIRYFEITPDPPFVHYISTFQSQDPQRGIGFMPKRGCDVLSCEMTRFFRINNNGFCQVIPFVVPRKCELFQEDLYPDTCSDVPAITADEWWEGKNAEPELVHVVELANHVKKQEELVVTKKTSVFEKSKPTASATAAAAAVPATTQAASTVAASTTAQGQEVDVKKLTDAVIAEVQKQMSDLEVKQKEKVEELNSEIRKLKAMIVKHETRIRDLENRNRDLENRTSLQPQNPLQQQQQAVNNNNGNNSGGDDDDMDPDEV